MVFYDLGDRERIRTAGLPLRSVKRTTKNIERAGFPDFTFLFYATLQPLIPISSNLIFLIICSSIYSG